MDDDTSQRWELRRPDLVLEELQGRYRFDRPRTLLARVDGDYGSQRVTAATVLWRRPPLDELERTRVTERALAKLGLGMTGVPYAERPLVVTVVVRPGDCWWSFDESEAWLGMRYGCNLVDAIDGDILTVTARGWFCQTDGLSGTSPAAVWAADAAA
jgi:hypothetical protein